MREMTVAEQRYKAVLAAAGESVVERFRPRSVRE
jgi:hypothetical protein